MQFTEKSGNLWRQMGQSRDRWMKLRLVGQFRLLDGLGIDRSPRGAKARAVLAMLVQVPEHRRSRRWLEARLWSDRGADQRKLRHPSRSKKLRSFVESL